MKRYTLFCNMCGKEIKMEYDRPKEDVVTVEKAWGYFSEKDGEYHSFELCEACYDRLVAQFKIPLTIRKQTELL